MFTVHTADEVVQMCNMHVLVYVHISPRSINQVVLETKAAQLQ